MANQGQGAVVAQWNLTEGSGMTLSPQVGSISGTFNTSNVTWQSGGPPATNVGGAIVSSPYALRFPGDTNDYIDFGTSTTLVPSSLSVAFWAKDVAGAASVNQILLARYTSIPGSFEFGFAGSYLNFRIWPQTGSEIRVGFGGGSLNPFMLNEFEDNNWHLIVGTYDSQSGVGSLYVDSTLIDTRTMTNPPQAVAVPSSPLNLGRRAYVGAQEPYTGLIGGPLLLYDTALTLNQVRGLVQIPEPSTLLLAALGALGLLTLRFRRGKPVSSQTGVE
jgi:hypothetical protein